MELDKTLTCPKCSGKIFTVKREVTYLYSYKINPENINKTKDKMQSVPFLFDNREKENSKEYVECEKCGARYPVSSSNSDKIDMTILEKAIRSDYVHNPEYFG